MTSIRPCVHPSFDDFDISREHSQTNTMFCYDTIDNVSVLALAQSLVKYLNWFCSKRAEKKFVMILVLL